MLIGKEINVLESKLDRIEGEVNLLELGGHLDKDLLNTPIFSGGRESGESHYVFDIGFDIKLVLEVFGDVETGLSFDRGGLQENFKVFRAYLSEGKIGSGGNDEPSNDYQFRRVGKIHRF